MADRHGLGRLELASEKLNEIITALKTFTLLQVLVLSCGLLDVTDLVWWQPHYTPLEKDGIRRQSTAWLPGAIEVTSDPDNAQVRPNFPCSACRCVAESPYGQHCTEH